MSGIRRVFIAVHKPERSDPIAQLSRKNSVKNFGELDLTQIASRTHKGASFSGLRREG